MATYYFRNVGTAWNNTSSWSIISSSGASVGTIPTASDNVIFDSGSALSCPVTTTAGVCLTLNTTGYTGTITLNTTITVSGNITLGASTVLSGASALICNASATLTSAGNTTINCPFTLYNQGVSNTYTLADNWTFNSLFTTSAISGGLTHTINGNNIYCKAGITINGGSNSSLSLTTGTTSIHLTGTGSITTTPNSLGGLGNNFTINAPGATVTFVSGNIYYRTGTFKYIAGNLSGTSTLQITGSCSLDMNSGGLNYVTPMSVQAQAASTITMLSDWYLANINFAFAMTINGIGTSFHATGTINVSGAGITGTTVLRLKGSGVGQAVSSTGPIANDITIEAGANTVNIANLYITPRSGGQTITYSSGILNHTGTLIVTGPNPVTFNTSGVSWNNITFTGSSFTITLNSLLSVLGTIIFQNQNYTFTGTSGFTVGTLIWTAAPTITNIGIVLAAGKTYTVTSALTLYSSTIPTYVGLKSDSPGSVAYFKLNQGATLSVGNIQVTDIDSSGGQTIWAWRPGTLSNAINWRALTNASMQFASLFAN